MGHLKQGDRITLATVERVYAATRNTDLAEGRGVDIDHAYYATRDAAVVGASKIGVMGADGNVAPRLALRFGTGGSCSARSRCARTRVRPSDCAPRRCRSSRRPRGSR